MNSYLHHQNNYFKKIRNKNGFTIVVLKFLYSIHTVSTWGEEWEKKRGALGIYFIQMIYLKGEKKMRKKWYIL